MQLNNQTGDLRRLFTSKRVIFVEQKHTPFNAKQMFIVTV